MVVAHVFVMVEAPGTAKLSAEPRMGPAVDLGAPQTSAPSSRTTATPDAHRRAPPLFVSDFFMPYLKTDPPDSSRSPRAFSGQLAGDGIF
jgi:hypothetical protein